MNEHQNDSSIPSSPTINGGVSGGPALPPRPPTQITSQPPSLYGSISPEQARQEYWRNYEEEQRLKEQHWNQYQQQLQQLEQQINRLKIGQEYLLRSQTPNTTTPTLPTSTTTTTRLPYQLPPSHIPWYTSSQTYTKPTQTQSVSNTNTATTNTTITATTATTSSTAAATTATTTPVPRSVQSTSSSYPTATLYPSLYPPVQSVIYPPSSVHPYSQVVTHTPVTNSPVATPPPTNNNNASTTSTHDKNTLAATNTPSYLRSNSGARKSNGIHNWQVFVPPSTPSPLTTELSLHNSNIHSSNKEDHQSLSTLTKFNILLSKEVVDLELLSSLAISSGIPAEKRAITWQLLLHYLPPEKSERTVALLKQRSEYLNLVRKYWTRSHANHGDKVIAQSAPVSTSTNSSSGASPTVAVNLVPTQRARILGSWAEYDQLQQQAHLANNTSSPLPTLMTKDDFQLHHLVAIDVARTHPTEFVKLFSNPRISEGLERILYIWSQENKDIGYFQGLADVVSPFYLVYLTSCFGALSDNLYHQNKNVVSDDLKTYLPAVEADAYWSLCALMNNLRQDHPFNHGAAHAEAMMSEFFILADKINNKLMDHLVNKVGLELVCFALRWMLCLMTREFTTKNIIHLWDSYVAEKQGFSKFHIYVCVAFLEQLGPTLMETDDLGKCMHIVLKPPTQYWDFNNINHLTQQARLLRDKYPLQ